MPTASAPRFKTKSMKPARWAIRLGNDGGSSPTDADETTELREPVINLVHGKRLPSAEFTYNLQNGDRRIVDTQLELGFARQVQISQVPEDPSAPELLLFWGELGAQDLACNKTSEQISITATIEPYHFGDPLRGLQYRTPTGDHDPINTDDDVVFNPLINAVIEPNRSIYESNATYFFWLDPDSARTAAARQYGQGNDTPALWSLVEAIQTINWVCNPDETYITNPRRADLTNWLAGAPDVKNLELPTGKYLSEYLDMMLNPYGFGWAVTFAFDETGERVVSYRIFKLNDDATTTVLQQRPGDPRGVRISDTNVDAFNLQTGIVGQANQVTAIGDWEEYEVTIELVRGWLESEDDLSAEALTQSTGTAWNTHQRAWRLWVANEGGDYCGTRVTVAPIATTPLDLSSVLGAGYHIKNREPLDCLTHWKDDGSGEKKRRRPPFVEFYDADFGSWMPLPDGWGETVLNDHIAVMFAGDAPPAEFMALGTGARLRITCTIRGDERIRYTSTKEATSVNERTNEITVDVSDRYKSRVIQIDGDHASALDGVPSSDARDDSAALIEFADKMRGIEDAAIVRGTITMFGLHPQMKVGQTLSSIQGRNVSLNRLAREAVEKKYLQIVGITHYFEKQATVLKVAPILEDIS